MANERLNPSLQEVLNIAHGGTGASTAEEARKNLEITPENIGAVTNAQLTEYGKYFHEINCTDTTLIDDANVQAGIYELFLGDAEMISGEGGFYHVIVLRGIKNWALELALPFAGGLWISTQYKIYIRQHSSLEQQWNDWKLLVKC